MSVLEGDAGVPPEILIVRDLVNTVEWQEDDESWQSPADLGAWVKDRLGVVVRPSPSDLVLSRRLREGAREVLLAHAGHDARRWAMDDLNDALRAVPVVLQFDLGDARLDAAPDPPHVLGPLVLALDGAARHREWPRLKACSRDSCRWAYWDASRNGVRRWCSMEGCGNYIKMRRRNGADPVTEIIPTSMRAPTLIDVAARAGVSMKTVLNVVRHAPHVSEATRARVEAAIAELDYRPNDAARELALRRPQRG